MKSYLYKSIFVFILSCFAIPCIAATQGNTTTKNSKTPAQTTISVSFSSSKPGDTIRLQFYEDLLASNLTNRWVRPMEITSTMSQKGSCVFKFNFTKEFGYVSIIFKNDTDTRKADIILLAPMLIEKDDHFNIQIIQKDLSKPMWQDNLGHSFSGVSARKYNIMNGIDSVFYYTTKKGASTGFVLLSPDNVFDYKIKKALDYLEENKASIKVGLYDRLRANIFYGTWKGVRNSYLRDFYESLVKKKDTLGLKTFLTAYQKMNQEEHLNLKEDVLLDSKHYMDYCRQKEYFDCEIKYGKIDLEKVYASIKTNYQSNVRDKLIVSYFYWLTDNGTLVNYGTILKDAFKTVQNKFYYRELQQFNNRKIGSVAYNFSLPDTSNKKIHLSDFKGKVVFIDFWFTGCTSCSGFYLKDLSKAEDFFKGNPDIVFISVSIDRTMEFWKKTVRSGKYTSPDIINLYTDGLCEKHPVITYYNIQGYPHPMIIGKDGKLVNNNDARLRTSDSLIKMLQAACAAR